MAYLLRDFRMIQIATTAPLILFMIGWWQLAEQYQSVSAEHMMMLSSSSTVILLSTGEQEECFKGLCLSVHFTKLKEIKEEDNCSVLDMVSGHSCCDLI